MQLQLLQTHQALGRGNPQSLTLVLHELVLCFVCPRAESFPASFHALPVPHCISRGGLDEEARFSMGAGTTHTCPLCCS